MTSSGALDEALRAGASLFDAGAFWDAHEAWEQRWRTESGERERLLLQGLIQVAAAFHKLLVMNDAGAASRILARALAKLDALPLSPELADVRERVRACARDVGAGHCARERIPKLGVVSTWLTDAASDADP